MNNRRNLPLSALRVFESVAVHLHMKKAGDDLGVTPGAISHQIRSLEDRLGTKLFFRANNRLTLTPEGKRLYSSVNKAFDTLLDGTRNLKPDDLTGSLTIACTQTIATSWAAKYICEFSEAYPSIEITVREIEPRQKIIPRDIDIAICYGKPEKDDREATLLASPPLFPVCHPKIMRNSKPIQRPMDLYDFTLIHDHQVSWNRWFSEFDVDIDLAKSSIHFPNTSQALTAAILGFGVALGNSFETREFIKEGRLVRLINRSIEEEQSYYLLKHGPDNFTLKAQVFEEWISDAVRNN